jgi:protoheme IX farnesyltransferase
MNETIKLVFNVFKLRIGLAIMLSAFAGLAVTPGPAPAPWQTLVLALAVLLSAASAGAFNQYVEQDLDVRMRRTRNRPFVTGRLKPSRYWLASIGLLLLVPVAVTWLSVNGMAALYVFLGAFTYGVVYTVWLKRRTWANIVIGGLAGSFAVLAGAAAVDPHLGAAPLTLAVVLFLWTPPHFWSLAIAFQEDYAAVGVPMLPVVVGEAIAAWIILAHTLALVVLSLLPVAFGLGWAYLAAATVGGGYFIAKSIDLARHPGPKAAMANFHASLVQLGLLLLGAIVDAAITA